MFTTARQLQRYEKRERGKVEWSVAWVVVKMSAIATAFWVVCDIACNLSGLI